MPAISASSFTVDKQGNIYTCLNNILSINRIVFSDTISEKFTIDLDLTE